jgi:predicted NBD/HSP70 family sugar kinase
MPRTTAPDISQLPALPHWDTTPEDLSAAIREVKATLRARIAASGRSVEEVFAVIEHRVRDRVDEIVAAYGPDEAAVGGRVVSERLG